MGNSHNGVGMGVEVIRKPPRLIRINRVAEIMGVSTRTIQRWVTKGIILKPIRKGSFIAWEADEFENWLHS